MIKLLVILFIIKLYARYNIFFSFIFSLWMNPLHCKHKKSKIIVLREENMNWLKDFFSNLDFAVILKSTHVQELFTLPFDHSSYEKEK